MPPRQPKAIPPEDESLVTMSLFTQTLEQQKDFYKDMLQQQQDNFKSFVQLIIDGTNKRLDDVFKDVQRIKISLEFTQDKVDKMAKAQEEMNKLKKLETEILKSKEELDKMATKLDFIENQSRRNNLIVDGISEERGESWDVSEKKIKDMLFSKMGLNDNNIEIEQAHRIGQHQEGGRPRQIIVKLLRFKDKQTILSSAKKLKGTRIYINEDFSEAVMKKRKELLPKLQVDRGSVGKILAALPDGKASGMDHLDSRLIRVAAEALSFPIAHLAFCFMADQTIITPEWLPDCFTVLNISKTHVSGFITNKADLNTVLECHKRETLTSFIAWSDDKRKKEKGPHRLVWQVEDFSEDVPLAVTNRVIHCCQHGNPRKNCQTQELFSEDEHIYSGKRKRMYIQTTKKVFIRYIRRFDKFSIEKGASKVRKQVVMDTLKAALQKNEAESSEIIHIILPFETDHQHHKISAESGYTRNIHPLVKKKIQEYVSLGITSVPFLKKVLCQFVNTELSVSDCVLPKSHDQYSGLDQLNLEIKLNKWKEDDPAAHFYFRKCSEAQIIDDKSQDGDGVNSEEKESTMQNTFLFVHQSQEQQRLLKRTNVGYKPVAEFICENESTMAISEALSLIKKWNDAWNPNYFMTDYCEQEYQALQLVFPNTPKYLCSFHREQAWIRWTRESKNHLSDQDHSEVLGLLRSVASAHDRETCEAAISKLRDSVLYKSNTEVRNYVEKRWLNIKERWCRGFSPHGFNVSVTTNNGTEAMNNSLKSFYLKISGTKTVSSLVEIIVTEFIPEQLLSYAKLNYMYSSEHKVYSANVPEFLWDRPRTFVQHCLKNLEAACCYTSQQVQEQSKGLYKVQSEQSCEWYSVDLGDKDRFPSYYISSPYVTLDTDVVSSQNNLKVKEVIDKDDTVCANSLVGTTPTCNDEDNTEHPVAIDCHDIQCTKTDTEANGVSTAQCALREKLKIPQDLSYICVDHELLLNATAVIHEITRKMKFFVPKEDSLPLLSKQDDKLKLRVLPSRKRKGKVKGKKSRIEKRNSGDQSGFLKENLLTDFAAIDLPEAETLLAELSKHEIEVDSGVRLSVCGQVLESSDFESLKHPHWLNDKVINAYLDTLTLENNIETNTGYRCFNISTYMPVLWERDRFDAGLFEKTRNPKYLVPALTRTVTVGPANSIQLQPRRPNSIQLQLQPRRPNSIQLQLQPCRPNSIQLQPRRPNSIQLQLQPRRPNSIQLQPRRPNSIQLQLQPRRPNSIQLQPRRLTSG
ncbi:unnamed protein product [Leuciscus chuanchicus]